MNSSQKELGKLLERAYQEYHSHYHRERDPVSLVHTFKNPKDQEVVAFLAALLSYGNVSTILSSIRKVLGPLGSSPYQFIKEQPLGGLWRGFYHRFTTGEDIEILFHWLKAALNSHESLEDYFLSGSRPNETMKDLIGHFVRRLTEEPLPAHLLKVKEKRQRNLKYLISDPARGSACKRINLFLRWVVRPQDGIDLGLWQKVDPSKLILPLDTHLLKTLKRLKWVRTEQASWKIAEKATNELKRYCPTDPLRFDFALCHLSMEGGSINAKMER